MWYGAQEDKAMDRQDCEPGAHTLGVGGRGMAQARGRRGGRRVQRRDESPGGKERPAVIGNRDEPC